MRKDKGGKGKKRPWWQSKYNIAWRWKVYDHHPHDQMSLLDAMNTGCLNISSEYFQRWTRHAKRFFPRCISQDDISCDVDENLWPNAEDRVDQHCYCNCIGRWGIFKFFYFGTMQFKKKKMTKHIEAYCIKSH